MQKTYVFTTNVNFSQFEFYVVPADTGVYDAAKMTMTVYRGGELIKTFHLPLSSLKSMLELSWIHEEGGSTKASKHHEEPKEEPEEIILFTDIENLDKMADMEVAPLLSKKQIEPEEYIELEGDEDPDGETEHISIEPEGSVSVVETEERISFDSEDNPQAAKAPARKLPTKGNKPGPKSKGKA